MWFHAEIKLFQTRAAAIGQPSWNYFILCVVPSRNEIK